jgi:glycosyltransferase involved in cell wall biosynthesis
MAAGAPVVATAVGGTTELIIDDDTGFLAPPADADALARRILDALQNPEWSARLAAQGRRRVLGLFGMRRMVESVEQLYDEMYGLNRTRRNWYRTNHGEHGERQYR